MADDIYIEPGDEEEAALEVRKLFEGVVSNEAPHPALDEILFRATFVTGRTTSWGGGIVHHVDVYDSDGTKKVFDRRCKKPFLGVVVASGDTYRVYPKTYFDNHFKLIATG